MTKDVAAYNSKLYFGVRPQHLVLGPDPSTKKMCYTFWEYLILFTLAYQRYCRLRQRATRGLISKDTSTAEFPDKVFQ